jgi:hypothetical protein
MKIGKENTVDVAKFLQTDNAKSKLSTFPELALKCIKEGTQIQYGNSEKLSPSEYIELPLTDSGKPMKPSKNDIQNSIASIKDFNSKIFKSMFESRIDVLGDVKEQLRKDYDFYAFKAEENSVGKFIALRNKRALKIIEPGKAFKFEGGKLDSITEAELAIDEGIDLILTKNKIYIFNVHTFDSLFKHSLLNPKKCKEIKKAFASKIAIEDENGILEQLGPDNRSMRTLQNLLEKEAFKLANNKNIKAEMDELDIPRSLKYEKGKFVIKSITDLETLINLIDERYSTGKRTKALYENKIRSVAK